VTRGEARETALFFASSNITTCGKCLRKNMMKTDNLRNLSHKKHWYNGIPWCFHGDDQPNDQRFSALPKEITRS
jgi:hypothetical protein